MTNHTIIDDLYRYNSWANERVFKLCDGLSDAQLDEPRPMGFGSLRNTMFHILAAEEIWFERWMGVPWRPFPTDAEGLPLEGVAGRLRKVAAERQALMEREQFGTAPRLGESSHTPSGPRVCQFKDSMGNSHSMRLDGLLLHVANHGTYHRSQALNFLKRFGRTVPGGLDYLFFRFANPHVKQDAATADSMRKFGLEVATGSSAAVAWDAGIIRNYFAYGDWATGRLLELVAPLDAPALDHEFGMGMGTIRKTLLHIADAERWWLRNWTTGPAAFDQAPNSTTIPELRGQWAEISAGRDQFIASLDDSAAQRIVTAMVGGMSIRVPVIEALIQLCGHGTHHRAQITNMLRHTGVTAPASDYVVWLRKTA